MHTDANWWKKKDNLTAEHGQKWVQSIKLWDTLWLKFNLFVFLNMGVCYNGSFFMNSFLKTHFLTQVFSKQQDLSFSKKKKKRKINSNGAVQNNSKQVRPFFKTVKCNGLF